jgi:hypothetical protein
VRLNKTHPSPSLLIILVIACSILQVTPVSTAPSDPEVQAAITYLRNNQNPDGSINDYGTTCWAAMAIKAANLDPKTFDHGGDSVTEYLVNNAGSIDKNSVSELSRFILAMSASGLDSSDIDGYDYVSKLQSRLNSGQYGAPSWLFDDFWPVIALCSVRTPATDPSIADPVNFIVANQNLDGGWGWAVGAASDVDDTAAAIIALRASGMSHTGTVIQSALNYFRGQQMPDGGFPSWGASNSDSDSWGISALISSGEDPATWLSGGNSLIDHLKSLQNPDGSFNWQPGNPGFSPYLSTSYAVVALSGRSYPTGYYSDVTYVNDPDNSRPEVSCTVRVVGESKVSSKLEFTNFDVIEFNGTSIDPDGRIKNYEWVFFGDHTVKYYTKSCTHQFTEPGRYLVRQRVWDNKGKRGQKDHFVTIDYGEPPSVIAEVYYFEGGALIALQSPEVANVAEIWYTLDGGNPVNLLHGPPIVEGSGEHALVFWCIDENGNKGEPEEIKFTIG